MCGRSRLATPVEELAETFGVQHIVPATWSLRLNIAPSDPMPIVRVAKNGERELTQLRWGLVPWWSEGPASGRPLFNARKESLATKPAFREALGKRRCLVIADGFYEWKHEGRHRIPYRVQLEGGRAFGMAGLWERWVSRDGEVIESCTVVTRDADGVVKDLHDRMPVVLSPEAWRAWLDPSLEDAPAVLAILDHDLASKLESSVVDPEVLAPARETRQQKLFG